MLSLSFRKNGKTNKSIEIRGIHIYKNEMKFYSVSNGLRAKHYVTIFVVSLILSGILQFYSNRIFPNVNIREIKFPGSSVILINVSFLVIYAIIHRLYDLFLWKFVSVILTGMPNLEGDWIGYIKERKTYPDQSGDLKDIETSKTVRIVIRQTFRKMSIVFHSINDSDDIQNDGTEAEIIGIKMEGFHSLKLEFTWARNGLTGRTVLTADFKSPNWSFLKRTQMLFGRFHSMSGDYVSSSPAAGRLRLERIKNLNQYYCGEVVKNKSRSNNDFLSIDVPEKYIAKYRKQMLTKFYPKSINDLENCRVSKNGESYHITVIQPHSYKNEYDEVFLEKSFWLQFKGLGYDVSDTNRAVYVECNCKELNKIRRSIGLKERGFHVTLGFFPMDIFNIRKRSGHKTSLTLGNVMWRFLTKIPFVRISINK